MRKKIIFKKFGFGTGPIQYKTLPGCVIYGRFPLHYQKVLMICPTGS